jgi:hypothetical protein
MPLTGMTRRSVMAVSATQCQGGVYPPRKEPTFTISFGLRVHVDRETTTMTYQLGLALPAVQGPWKSIGERRFVALHDDLYGRKYYRLKAKDPSGEIESVEAKKAIWQSAREPSCDTVNCRANMTHNTDRSTRAIGYRIGPAFPSGFASCGRSADTQTSARSVPLCAVNPAWNASFPFAAHSSRARSP